VKRRALPERNDGGAPISLRVAGGGGERLSEGAFVQGSIRARLLGLPLLRLDATIALLPARTVASRGRTATGEGLAEAVRSINAGADILADIRLNGRS
jgi:hypothetical protein